MATLTTWWGHVFVYYPTDFLKWYFNLSKPESLVEACNNAFFHVRVRMKNWRSQFISINVVEQTCDWVCLFVYFVQLKIVPSFS